MTSRRIRQFDCKGSNENANFHITNKKRARLFIRAREFVFFGTDQNPGQQRRRFFQRNEH
jgi:hypothetical protein